jgi:pimeloyl-ACP methyl ester carboxylesterase
VVFCGGFMSDMTGTKALALEAFCRERGQGYVRFDYLGHGESSGDFADGTIGRWTDDALAVIDALDDEAPVLLVGSSMGGWIMLLAALARRQRVAGLVGIAAAPDFTRRMVEEEFDDEQRLALLHQGRVELPSEFDDGPYVITQALIDDGNGRCLLDGPIALDIPVRLLHGMQDSAVPWQTALTIAEALQSEQVIVTLVKDGDHRLSEPADIARLCAAVAEVSELLD